MHGVGELTHHLRDQLLAHLLDETRDVLVVVDDQRVLFTNAASERRLPAQARLPMVAEWRRLFHPDDVWLVEALTEETAPAPECEVRVRTGGDEWRRFRIRALQSPGASGGPTTVLVLRDIADAVARVERAAALELDLQRTQLHDPVTGLPRRSMLVAAAEARSATSPPTGPSIVEVIVQQYSEQTGALEDRHLTDVMTGVAELIAAELNAGDLLGRGQFGEFVVLLAPGTHDDRTVELATRILNASSQGVGRDRTVVDLAIGVADSEDQTIDVVAAFKHATIAASWATDRSAPAIERYSQERRWRGEHRASVRGEVRRALRDRKFDIHLQPVIETGSGRVIAAEALLRWDPREVDLPPLSTTLEATRHDALGQDLDRYVLDLSLSRLEQLQSEFGVDCPGLNINVSPTTLGDPAFLGHLARSLGRYRIDPSLICLEITEQVTADVDDALLTCIRHVKALGVRVAIDDFGSGYSSLTRLNRLDVDVIKIDRSLVSDVVDSERSGDIVTSVLHIGRSLDIEIVAEGVETAAQRAWLDAAGCPYVQGFLISRPLPWEDALGYLRTVVRTAPDGGAEGPGRTPATTE